MAFSALKPCSRIMRETPHQSDQQQEKEAYSLLLLKRDEKEDDAESEKTPHSKSFTCEEEPPFKQLISSSPSSFLSDSSSASPLVEEAQPPLPTFIAPQGIHSLQPAYLKEDQCTKNCRIAKQDHTGRHLVPLCEEEAFTQSFLDSSFPASDFQQCRTHSGIRSWLQSKPKKPNSENHERPKQKFLGHKKCGSATYNSIYGLALDQTASVNDELVVEKKRHSSASARDMISSKDAVMYKNRLYDVQSSSWEEEVRQAMACKSSLSRRANSELACKSGAEGYGLQRSISVNEKYECSALPSSLIVKQRTNGTGNVDATSPAICEDGVGVKFMHGTGVGSRSFLNKSAAEGPKRMWKGFSVVKSPSEERWEEAAQDEERQELQRRAARSQSMRYDAHPRATDLAGIGKPDGANAAFYSDEPEWAVYTRSGYITVRPRRSNVETSAAATCCSSLMGRSSSMRDTRMGLVMECAACGTSLHGLGGQRLLCFCSCCAAARSVTTQSTPSSQKKKVGSGILRACRRLLGLSKKHAGSHL